MTAGNLRRQTTFPDYLLPLGLSATSQPLFKVRMTTQQIIAFFCHRAHDGGLHLGSLPL